MTDFSGLLYFWIFLGFFLVFYSIQLYALDILLDKFKNKFPDEQVNLCGGVSIIWIFGGELIICGYLFNYLTQ